MTDTTVSMTTETATEKASETKVEPMATEDSVVTASTNEPAESSTTTDAGKVEKPSENGTTDSTNAEAPPKLFVGRLPIGTKDAQLKELFSTYGEVTHCDIVGKYGFVHMKVKEEANEAMLKLNNHTFNGSNITVQMSTSTAKKTKKKQNRPQQNNNNKKNTNNANTSTNSNQATPNRRQNVKNGFQQKVKNTNGSSNNNATNNNKSNSNLNNNGNNRNKIGGNANNNNNTGNNRQNGTMNKMRSRKFNNNRMHPMIPQLAPMNQGYYPNNQPPMNQPYYQQPMATPQMQPVGGPRDIMYNNYNSRPVDNGQYYRSNGQSPQPMYGGMVPPVQPQQNYYQQPPQQQPQQPYNSRVPVGSMGKMNTMPTHPQQQMYGSPIGMGPMASANPGPMNTGYGQMNSGYGNSPMMSNTNGVNNFSNRNGYAKGRGNNNRFNNYTPNHNRPNKRAKLN